MKYGIEMAWNKICLHVTKTTRDAQYVALFYFQRVEYRCPNIESKYNRRAVNAPYSIFVQIIRPVLVCSIYSA
jgi:hypothetical protein